MTPRRGEPIRVLELRSVRGTGGGPEKTILAGAARSNPERVKATVCYIRDRRDGIFEIDRRAAALGVDYVEIPERHSFDVSAWSAVRRLVRDRAIDIVHAHDYKTDLMAACLAAAEGIAVVATAHGWTGHSARERLVYYPADRRLLARFPRVIAVSGDIRRALLAAGAPPDRVTTVLNGIDHRAFHRNRLLQRTVRRMLEIEPLDVIVGAVGRLEPQKRFDLLIDAVAAVRRRRPGVRLFVAGDGSLRKALEAQAARALGGGGCVFLGLVPEIGRLHHAFDVFVQASDYEGTPNAVLEAMALETPVVATDAGGTAELVTDGVEGRVVARGDVEAIARSIEDTLEDRERSARMAEAARRKVEGRLSFDARMAAVERIYDEIMKGRAGWSDARRVPAV